MEPESSLPCSQQPGTVPYREPDESSLYLPTYFPKIHSNIVFPSMLRSSEWRLCAYFGAIGTKNEIYNT